LGVWRFCLDSFSGLLLSCPQIGVEEVMTKSELIDKFARDADISRQRAAAVVDAFFDALSESLAEGSRVELRTFGNFSVREYKPYVGRNPKTGESVYVPGKRLPYFKPSSHLRDRLAGKTD
jgi:integration host factor subunit beta